jgi:hypothetical protein
MATKTHLDDENVCFDHSKCPALKGENQDDSKTAFGVDRRRNNVFAIGFQTTDPHTKYCWLYYVDYDQEKGAECMDESGHIFYIKNSLIHAYQYRRYLRVKIPEGGND